MTIDTKFSTFGSLKVEIISFEVGSSSCKVFLKLLVTCVDTLRTCVETSSLLSLVNTHCLHVSTLHIQIAHCPYVLTLWPDVSTLIFLDLNICSLFTCVDSSTDVSTLYIQIQSPMSSCIDSLTWCVDTFNQFFGYYLDASTPHEHVSTLLAQNIFLCFPWRSEYRSIQVL